MPRSNVVMLLSSYQKNGFQATLPMKKIFKKSAYFEEVYPPPPPPKKKDYIHKLVYHSPNTSNAKNKTKLSTKPYMI